MIHVRRSSIDILKYTNKKTTAICGKKISIKSTISGTMSRLGRVKERVCPICKELAREYFD